MSDEEFYEDDSLQYHNDESVTIGSSMTVIVAPITSDSDPSAEIVEGDSTQIGSTTQEQCGETAAFGDSYQLTGEFQIVDSGQTDEHLQSINDAYLQQTDGLPATTSSQSFNYTQTSDLPSQTQLQSTCSQTDGYPGAPIQSQQLLYSTRPVYSQNGAYQQYTVDHSPQPAASYQTSQNHQLAASPQSHGHAQTNAYQQSITNQIPQPIPSYQSPPNPHLRPSPQNNPDQTPQPAFSQNSQRPQSGSFSQNNPHTIYQRPQPAASSQNSHKPQPRPYAHNNTSTPHRPQPSASSQNFQRPRPRPSTQNNTPATDQNSQPIPSNQAPQNLQSGPSYQDSSYVENNTYQQSITYQEPPPTESSQLFQDSQPNPPQECAYSQDNIYQQPTTEQDSQPNFSSQTVQDPQSNPPPDYSYPHNSTYHDPQQPASTQAFQSAPSDPSAQEHAYPENCASGETTYQDSQAASFPQTSQSSQVVDNNVDSSEQFQGYHRDPDVYFQSTTISATTDDNFCAGSGDTSLAPESVELNITSDQTQDGYDLSNLGAALFDGGLDGDEDGGANLVALAGDNFSLDMVTAGASIAQTAANAMSGMDPAAMVNAGIGIANNAVNAVSLDDPMAAVQAGLGVAMSGVRIAASIGTWNKARQRRKESAVQLAATHGPTNPVVSSKVAIATQLDEVLLVLSVLGQRLVVLEVINLAELPQALVACRTACGQADSGGDLLAHFDTLDGTLQYSVTAALFFCAACFPMHIYRGFGTGVLDNFLWGCPHPQYTTGQTQGFKSVDRTIAFLKSTPREVQLLTRVPAGLNRIVPIYEKSERIERRRLMNAYKEFVREIEIQGHPQPKDSSFRVVSWHFPFATWNSPFTFRNAGHYFEDFLRWQMDAGRLLHAWTIGGHLDLMHGEMMWLPPGVAETLARWLVGLPGMTFKLVPSSAFDYCNLRLSPTTRKIMLEEGFESVKAVRDVQADLSRPVNLKNIFVPAPPSIRRRPAAPVSNQLSDTSVVMPLSHQPLAKSGPSAQREVPAVTTTVNHPMTHGHLGHQTGGQKVVANHDPQNLSSQPTPTPFMISRATTSPPAGIQASHSVTRPGLIPHHSPQLMYQSSAGSSTGAFQAAALPMASHGVSLQSNQQHVSPPNLTHAAMRGRQINPNAMAPPPGLQHYQQPLMTQVPLPTTQRMSLHPNESPIQAYPTTNNNVIPGSQNSLYYPHASGPNGSQVAHSNQFPPNHRFTSMAPSQTPSISRKPTNAALLRSAENLPTANSHHQSPNPSHPLPQLHTPTFISRTSTLVSNHSTSSNSSDAPNLPPDAPTASSISLAPTPNSAQPESPFYLQSTGTIKRRAVPPPPPPLLAHPPALRQVKAIHDFTPEQQNELGFKAGDLLDVLDDSSEDGWWEARLKGKVGAIPGSYVGEL